MLQRKLSIFFVISLKWMMWTNTEKKTDLHKVKRFSSLNSLHHVISFSFFFFMLLLKHIVFILFESQSFQIVLFVELKTKLLHANTEHIKLRHFSEFFLFFHYIILKFQEYKCWENHMQISKPFSLILKAFI